jgi:hypothetical protein
MDINYPGLSAFIFSITDITKNAVVWILGEQNDIN